MMLTNITTFRNTESENLSFLKNITRDILHNVFMCDIIISKTIESYSFMHNITAVVSDNSVEIRNSYLIFYEQY